MSGPRCLTVRHKSTYRYSAPVSFGEHRMMFRPRSGHDLRLVTFQLSITPTPASLHWLHDVFDNSVAIATFSEEASQLRFDSTVTLEHYETPLPEYAIEPYAADAPLHGHSSIRYCSSFCSFSRAAGRDAAVTSTVPIAGPACRATQGPSARRRTVQGNFMEGLPIKG